MLASLLLLVTVVFLGAKHVAAWTVVTSAPIKADAIVVLGGGDGSRLRAGLRHYDQGYAPRLVLVDRSKADWLHITRNLCRECDLDGKDVTFLDGSVSTQTDAELTLAHCRRNGLKSVLVVTSPYHTRRAQLVFADIHGPAGVDATVVSSGDYTKYVPPTEQWWHDQHTLEFVWLEVGKILYWLGLGGV